MLLYLLAEKLACYILFHGCWQKTSGQRPKTLLLTVNAVARAYHIILCWLPIPPKSHESNAKGPSFYAF